MDFLYQFYDTTILLVCVGAVIVTVLVMAAVYYVYYRERDIGEDEE